MDSARAFLPYASVLYPLPGVLQPGAGQGSVRRKRKRELVTVACLECKEKKTKCSDNRPCDRCVRLNIPGCSDVVADSEQPLGRAPSSSSGAIAGTNVVQRTPINLLHGPRVIAAGLGEIITGLTLRAGGQARGFSLTMTEEEGTNASGDDETEGGSDPTPAPSAGRCPDSSTPAVEKTVASMSYRELVAWLRDIDVDQEAIDTVAKDKVSICVPIACGHCLSQTILYGVLREKDSLQMRLRRADLACETGFGSAAGEHANSGFTGGSANEQASSQARAVAYWYSQR